MDQAEHIELWCEDCEDIYETRVYAPVDREHCPHCRGMNVREIPPMFSGPVEVVGLQYRGDQ